MSRELIAYEAFISYTWQYRLYHPEKLYTIANEKISVKHPGIKNTNAGPDFLNAKIIINGTEWVGNVEIHSRASDWNKHGHQNDPAYNNVILHVVNTNDEVVYTQSGRTMPSCVLPVKPYIVENYDKLQTSKKRIPCENHISEVDDFLLQIWFEKLLIERLQQRSEQVNTILTQTKQDWSETMYISLAGGMGTSVNKLPFQLLAQHTPVSVLGKHKNSLFQIEALLFGQAGFLNDEPQDEYSRKLTDEYRFLSQKYNLKPIERQIWKTFRLRPGNFPWIRIAQLAAIIHLQSGLFSKFIETKEISNFYNYFDVETSDYWLTHYKLGKESVKRKKKIGRILINSLLINSVIPVIFEYGKYKRNDELKSRALSLLEQIPAENNAMIKSWEEIGITAQNAKATQALIHLKKEYCEKQRCLSCQIGDKLIRNSQLI